MMEGARQKMGQMSDRLRERRMEGRLDDLDRENVRLRTEVSQLRTDLAHERSSLNAALSGLRGKPTVVKEKRRPGLVRLAMVGGGAYLLGTRAGRERYDRIMGWVDKTRRSMTGADGWSGDDASSYASAIETPAPSVRTTATGAHTPPPHFETKPVESKAGGQKPSPAPTVTP